jgi:hypothetical protein
VNQQRGLAQPAPTTDCQQTGRRGAEDGIEFVQFSLTIDQHWDNLQEIDVA